MDMRKAAAALLALLLCFALSLPVFAAAGAQSINASAYVSTDGSCQVSVSIVLSPDTVSGDLSFPIPGDARNVTLNGSSASSRRSGSTRWVDLKGSFAPTISYTLTGLVSTNSQGQLELKLPLLSGFAYPVQELRFMVTLPGEFTASPSFFSTYYQENIELDLDVKVSGTSITGSTTKPLKDMETLTMTLIVPQELFPQSGGRVWSAGSSSLVMGVLAVLAAAYWVVFLRCLPPKRVRTTLPPEGLNAGQLGSALIGQGADLTMMVLSWAQLGYILIHLDDSGRAVLHKRMNMGNERSAFEIKCFNQLFGKRQMVDGTGYHYAQLFRKIAAKKPNIRDFYLRKSGNPKVLRVLAALIGVLGGMTLGTAIAGGALLGVLLVAILAVAGGASAWVIQDFVRGLHLRRRDCLFAALVFSGVWLLLGLAANTLPVSLLVVLGQLLAGLAAAYGGRRTELGSQTMSQILGLRRFLRTAPKADLQRALRNNPEYYFTLAPYAEALGIGKAFAKRFGAKRLNACPYLTTGMDSHMTALEWSQMVARAVSALDARQKRLPYERLFNK